MDHQEIIAVIDLGSSAIRLLIAQSAVFHAENGTTHEWDLLDSAEQPLAIGRDVFRKGIIDPRTTNRAVQILKGFQELMAPYGVDRIVAIGTSALRESANREMFIDRVLLQTGIEIQVIDGVESNQLTWLAVREPLEQAMPGLARHNALIIEVGAGNTDLMILQQGKITSAHGLPIGTLRFLQQLDLASGINPRHIQDFFRNHAVRTVRAMAHELGLSRVSKLVAIGGDARLVASRLGQPLTDEMSVISREDFRDFMNEIATLTPDEVVERIDLPWNEAELLYPALVIFDTFVEATRAKEILVPSVSIREGLLIRYAASPETLREIFQTQIIAAAGSLAKHYRSDTRHTDFVREQACIIYEALVSRIGLKPYYRLFLEIAAMLHDVGSFISATSHHRHSQYIVHNSGIFGMSGSDKEIVGHIVRYHRRAKPQSSHSEYMNLSRSDRIIVQKLSAILRVAESLDRSHTQKTGISRIVVNEDKLILYTRFRGDLSLEELSLSEKGDLFEDVFGLKPVIRIDSRA